jgi:hypothetical protein
MASGLSPIADAEKRHYALRLSGNYGGPLQEVMKKATKSSTETKSPREDIGHSRPKRRTRSSFLLEADIVMPSAFRASFEGHLPYRRIIE